MNTDTLNSIRHELRLHADPSRALKLQRFFKTGPGEYGEGDRFLGIRVPDTRRVARKYRDIPLKEVVTLLHSAFHEERLAALILLVHQYQKGSLAEQTSIYNTYLENREFINNWDLVDTSAEHIVGAYLKDRSRDPLYGLAQSASLWERRIAILATFCFIKSGEFDETLKIAESLLHDKEMLIHKAVGWMLREVGKRNERVEVLFLDRHHRHMPRTMLRYAVEKFPDEIRRRYVRGARKASKTHAHTEHPTTSDQRAP